MVKIGVPDIAFVAHKNATINLAHGLIGYFLRRVSYKAKQGTKGGAMSDRERRVTFKLGGEQYRQLQALATLKLLTAEEVAAGAVIFHVDKCMKAIQSRPFPELLIDVTTGEVHHDDPDVVIPPGYLATVDEVGAELPDMELFEEDNREILCH